jgi:hypothetical protein
MTRERKLPAVHQWQRGFMPKISFFSQRPQANATISSISQAARPYLGTTPIQGFATSAVSNQLRRDTKNTMDRHSETVR